MEIFNRVAILLTILAVVLLPTTTIATEYVVGDDRGWTINFDYQAWAKTKDFKVGDTLVFIYPKDLHNVFKVNGSSYANCVIPPPSQAYTSGHDTITLSSPGKEWFLCGIAAHCSEFNQKVAINVKA